MLEREDEVRSVIERMGEVLRVDDIDADLHHRRTEPGCAATLDLDEADAWYERNTFAFVGSGRSLDDLFPAAVAHFVDEGFTVDELLAPRSGSRALRAIRDDVGVLMNFGQGEDVGANLTVTAGPCAVELSPVGERYHIVATRP